MKTALILGASGLVGSELLKQVLEDPTYSIVTILVRESINISHQKLRELIIDFTGLERYENEFAVNHVYCCLGSTIKRAGSREQFRLVDHDYPLLAARLSKGKAEKFLVISAQGADAKSMIFYNKIKGEMERDLIALNLNHLLIFRPSLILGPRKQKRTLENLAGTMMKLINPWLKGSWRKYQAIPAGYLAECMVSAAKGIFLCDKVEILKFPQN